MIEVEVEKKADRVVRTLCAFGAALLTMLWGLKVVGIVLCFIYFLSEFWINPPEEVRSHNIALVAFVVALVGGFTLIFWVPTIFGLVAFAGGLTVVNTLIPV